MISSLLNSLRSPQASDAEVDFVESLQFGLLSAANTPRPSNSSRATWKPPSPAKRVDETEGLVTNSHYSTQPVSAWSGEISHDLLKYRYCAILAVCPIVCRFAHHGGCGQEFWTGFPPSWAAGRVIAALRTDCRFPLCRHPPARWGASSRGTCKRQLCLAEQSLPPS